MNGSVAITGGGAVTPLGASAIATREAYRAGRSAIAPCTLFDLSTCGPGVCGEVRGFDPLPYFSTPKALKLTDRMTRFAVASGVMALRDANLPVSMQADMGIIVGCSTWDLQAGAIAIATIPDPDRRSAIDIPFFAERILAGLNPLWLLMMLPNMTSSHLAIQLAARGPNSTLMTGAAAGVQALGEAAEWICRGEATAVLAGGVDSALAPTTIASFEQAGVYDDALATPPGEGCAMFLVESGPHAKARGARILGHIEGYATATGPCALTRAIGTALSDAQWTTGSIETLCLGGVPDIPDLSPHARRIVLDRTAGDALAASAPVALAVALDGSYGARILCAAAAVDGLAAALAVELTTGGTTS